MLFNGNSVFIKDVRKLELRDEVTNNAQQLIKQIEYPVVFWINAETDKNYAVLHPQNPNQFFITIKHGTTKKEMERIVLANLYKAIQLRKRYYVSLPRKEYLEAIECDKGRVKLLSGLIGEINSFASSLECQLFLEQFGIFTDEEVKRNKFEHYRDDLLDYIQLQHANKGYQWYKENEASNLIGYAACSRFDVSYYAWFKKNIMNVRPVTQAAWYCSVLSSLQEMIEEMRRSYNGLNGDIVVEKFNKELIKILNLESLVDLDRLNAYKSFTTINGKKMQFYTFIPDDIQDRELLIHGVRAANECLGLYREIYYLKDREPRAQIATSCDTGNNMSSYVSKDGKNYYVLIYVDFLKRLEEIISSLQLGERIEGVVRNKGIEYVKYKLLKYTVFYITLHEYGHIVHGDCDNLKNESIEIRKEKERKANEFATSNFCHILNFQYRQVGYREFMEYTQEDKILVGGVKNIIDIIQNKV